MTLSSGALTQLLVRALEGAGLVFEMQTGAADRPLLLRVRSIDRQTRPTRIPLEHYAGRARGRARGHGVPGADDATRRGAV